MPRQFITLGILSCLGLVSCRAVDHRPAASRALVAPASGERPATRTSSPTNPAPGAPALVGGCPAEKLAAAADPAHGEVIREVSFDSPEATDTESSPREPQPLPDPSILEGTTGPIGLTLVDVESIALANNPSLQVAGFGVADRRGVRTQVGLYPNPVVGYAAEEIGDEGTAGKQGAFVSQTIVRGRKLALNRAVAQWDTEEASWIAETRRYQVLNDVRTAFYDALGAQRRIEIGRELVELAEKGVETAEALIEAKQAARPDVLQAEVQLNEVAIVLRNAELEYEAAWNRLGSLMGQPYLAPTSLVGDLQEELPEAEWETAYATLVGLSPELRRAEARIQRARVLVQRQRVQPIPNVLTQFGVANDYATDTVIANVQIGVPLPTNNRNQGNVRAAIAESHRTERDAERIRMALRERLAVAIRDYSQARQQAERYRTKIVPKSRESYELIEVGYEQGEFDFLRVLTARRLYFEAQLAYVRSLVQLNRQHVALEGLLLTGGLDPVPTANQASGLRGQALSGQ